MNKLRLILLIGLFLSFNVQAQNNLDFYIYQAEQNSPFLQKQENNKTLIELDLKQLNAVYKSPIVNLNSNVLFLPIVSVNGNTKKLEWVSAGSTDYYGYDLGATNGGQYQALVSVSQPLFTRKYLAVQQNNANLLQEQNLNTAQLTKAELKQTVTHQHILCSRKTAGKYPKYDSVTARANTADASPVKAGVTNLLT